MKERGVRALLAVLLFSLTISAVGCTGTTTINQAAQPTLAPANQPTASRPPMLIQFCNDDTGSFPRQDFTGANQLMANSLLQAVHANQQGITLFATAITHDTFAPGNTLDPAFKVPAIQAFPPAPTPVPTQPAVNPVTDPATATAVTQQTTSDILTYNTKVAAIGQEIEKTKGDVTKDIKRLTTWNPPVDTVATSVLGCFQLAASRFQGQSGIKMIYIASDLENNTDVDNTQTFVTSHALSGVIVHVIYLVSPSAARDHEKRAQWCPYLKAAGAKAVLFSDPTASPTLTDVFNNDMKLGEQSCL